MYKLHFLVLFALLASNTAHLTFAGIIWSKTSPPDTCITLPSEQELNRALDKEKTITWINKERFITTFAAQKMERDALEQKINEEFDATWHERTEKNLGFYTFVARQQFQDNKKEGTSILLTILLNNRK